METIILTLSDDELRELEKLIKVYGSKKLNNAVLIATDKLEKSSYIKHKVCAAISILNGMPYDEVLAAAETKDLQNLSAHLKLSFYHKQSLKNPLQKVVNDLEFPGKITVNECGNLETIDNCISLIVSKQ